MILNIKNRYTLEELLNTGCKLHYNPEACRFPMGEIRSRQEVHVLPIPSDWDCDNLGWAPIGFKPLHLSALIAVGVEYPDLQKQMRITATGAATTLSSISFPGYAFLGTDNEDAPVIGIDGIGFVPFCVRDSEKYGFKLVGLFQKDERRY